MLASPIPKYTTEYIDNSNIQNMVFYYDDLSFLWDILNSINSDNIKVDWKKFFQEKHNISMENFENVDYISHISTGEDVNSHRVEVVTVGGDSIELTSQYIKCLQIDMGEYSLNVHSNSAKKDEIIQYEFEVEDDSGNFMKSGNWIIKRKNFKKEIHLGKGKERIKLS